MKQFDNYTKLYNVLQRLEYSNLIQVNRIQVYALITNSSSNSIFIRNSKSLSNTHSIMHIIVESHSIHSIIAYNFSLSLHSIIHSILELHSIHSISVYLCSMLTVRWRVVRGSCLRTFELRVYWFKPTDRTSTRKGIKKHGSLGERR